MSDTPKMDAACEYLRRQNQRNATSPSHSDGAMYSFMGVQRLIKDGKELERELAAVKAENTALRAENAALEAALAAQTYRGNSIGYIYQKMICYREQAGIIFQVVEQLGIRDTEDNDDLRNQIMDKINQLQEAAIDAAKGGAE